MAGYDHEARRPGKWRAIAAAIDAGFDQGVLTTLYETGIGYYTLGGETFNDLRIFYNIFGSKIRFAVSYEKRAGVYKTAKRAARELQDSGAIGNTKLEVLPGDILGSSLNHVPRQNWGMILFLDLTEFITFSHRQYFERWITGGKLLPGDAVFVTSSLPPWELMKSSFVSKLGPILRDRGASDADIMNRHFWKENYVKELVEYFSDDWRYRQVSHLSLKSFFAQCYRDTNFEMVLSAFTVTE